MVLTNDPQWNNPNKRFLYSGTHQQKDYDNGTLFSSVPANGGTTADELIFSTKTLHTNVFAIWSKSSLNISKVLQDRFREHGIPMNIWSDNVQEYFMWSVRKLLRPFGVGIKQSEAPKQNHNPVNLRIK